MKIAVLISTYNGEKYLEEQLQSLAAQTVKQSMTVYIRDDGSTDRTFQVIDRWRNQISIVLYKAHNAGPAMSFWELLMNPQIQADYYAFCDQDDIWDPDKLEVAVNALNGQTCLYACNCRIVDQNGGIIHEQRLSQPPMISLRRLFITGCTQGCSMVFTDALRRHLMGLKISCVPMHDIVLMLYATQFGEIHWDQTPRFSYRVHSDNVVAKENKSLPEKLKTTYWNWKNSSKHSMSTVAEEMYHNLDSMTPDTERFLRHVSAYKKHKVWVICQSWKNRAEPRAQRSFVIRVLLGLY